MEGSTRADVNKRFFEYRLKIQHNSAAKTGSLDLAACAMAFRKQAMVNFRIQLTHRQASCR